MKKKMTLPQKEAEKHSVDTVHWMVNMIHKFTVIVGYIAEGLPIEEKEEDLRLVFELKKKYDSLLKYDNVSNESK
jgi:hypothetical protein